MRDEAGTIPRDREVPQVGVVVVHWRGMDETRQCLASLKLVTDPDVDVIVVVNGHEDFDRQAAEGACPGLFTVASDVNRGYAGGCNLSARAAIERGAEFVRLLNNDTAVEPNIFNVLIDTMNDQPDVGIAAPIVTYYDAPASMWSAGGYLNRSFGYRRHYLFDQAVPPWMAARAADFASGFTLMVRRDVWDRHGGMDERYLNYFEDVDLCVRARALGFETWVVPAGLAQHRVSVSAGTRGSSRFNRLQ